MRWSSSLLLLSSFFVACAGNTDPYGTSESAESVSDPSSGMDGKMPPPMLLAEVFPVDAVVSEVDTEKPPAPLHLPFVLPPPGEGSHCVLLHLPPPKGEPPAPPKPDGDVKPPPAPTTKPTLTVSSLTGTDDVLVSWSVPEPPKDAPEPKVAPLTLVQIALVAPPSGSGDKPVPPADVLSCVVAPGETKITIARTLVDGLLAKPHASEASAAVAVASFPPPPAPPSSGEMPKEPSSDAPRPPPPIGHGLMRRAPIS